MPSSIPIIKNILILDAEGKRIACKHFTEDFQNLPQQSAFEKNIFNKTLRTNARGEAEIIMFDNLVVVYKFVNDVHFYATGFADENELIIYSVLQALTESISILLRNNVEKRTVLENLDLILLAMDEIVDGGIVLENDASLIASRVAMRGPDTEGGPLSEQSLTQAFASAREQFTRSLMK